MNANYVAELEPLTSQLRIFKVGGSYGDQYIWTCTVRWLNPHEAELMAIVDFPDLSLRHAVAEAMHVAGAKFVFFTRIKNGKKKFIRLELANLIRRRKQL